MTHEGWCVIKHQTNKYCDHVQINHDQPLTIPKDWGGHLPCLMNPLKFLRRGWARVLPLFALHIWLWVKAVNPCLNLGYNSLDKTVGIIFIARQKIPRNIKPSPFLFNISSIHPAKTFVKPKMSVRIYCTAPKRMHTSLAMLRRSRHFSHIFRDCRTFTFLSAVLSLGRPDYPNSQHSPPPS